VLRRAFSAQHHEPRYPGKVPPGALSIADQSLTEPDAGQTNMTFTVQLSRILDKTVAFDYNTQDGVAIAGQDYVATSGIKTIPAGSLSTTIDVPIIGDTDVEPDEAFTLRLSNIHYL
jgi:hypothetical protein